MSVRRLLGGAVAAAALVAVAGGAAGGERHAGTVLAVDPQARSLILDEFGANADRRAVHVRVPRETPVVLSERNPGGRTVGDAFRDRTVGLDDVRVGDFVVVELSGDPEVARRVTITLRRGAGS